MVVVVRVELMFGLDFGLACSGADFVIQMEPEPSSVTVMMELYCSKL